MWLQKNRFETSDGRHLIFEACERLFGKGKALHVPRTPHDGAIYDQHSTKCLTLKLTKIWLGQ